MVPAKSTLRFVVHANTMSLAAQPRRPINRGAACAPRALQHRAGHQLLKMPDHVGSVNTGLKSPAPIGRTHVLLWSNWTHVESNCQVFFMLVASYVNEILISQWKTRTGTQIEPSGSGPALTIKYVSKRS